MKRKIRINFDMDGTIADLFGIENWEEKLHREDFTPYLEAKPMLRLCTLARMLNRLQKDGYEIAIISWLSMKSSKVYDSLVKYIKKCWLYTHLPSVNWDEITIVPYGTPKENYCYSELDILFDDSEENRKNWSGIAYDVNDIIDVLKTL